MNSNFIRLAHTVFLSICVATLSAGAASAIEFNLEVNTSGNPQALAIGDTVDVDVFMDNPLEESYVGVGTALIYDPAVYELTGVTPRTQVDLGGGTLATPVLAAPSGFGLSFLDNVIDPNEQSPGVILLVNALSTAPTNGDGSLDVPGTFTEARPHASIELTVIGQGDGTVATGFGQGQTLLNNTGAQVPEQAIFDSVTLTVPEPGATALGLVALSSVIGVVQIRRRFDAA